VAVNALAEKLPYVDTDMDDQQRDDQPDVGADELSPAKQSVRQPLSARDVGPQRQAK